MKPEDLRSGEVVCKIDAEEIQAMKKICVSIESLDESIFRLSSQRAFFCEMRTDWWEKIFDKYLITRGEPYHINWRTRELIKV